MEEKKNNYCICTVAIGPDFARLAKLTHPTIKAYADKIGADFIVIDKVDPKFITQKWQKFKIFDLLAKYDRILYLDTDIIVRPDCENLFDMIPYERVGLFNEGKWISRVNYLAEARIAYQEDINMNIDNNFYNTGVFIVSKCHRAIFKLPKNANDKADEQSYINLRLLNDKIQVEELNWNYNRMSMMDKKLGIDRRNSKIIHYAGAPKEVLFPEDMTKSIVYTDLEQWKKDAPDYKYKHNFQIFISAGMGDQLCVEPAVRYFKKKIYPDANVEVYTHHPRLFEHLVSEGITVKTYKENRGLPESTMILYSCPDDSQADNGGLSHALFHPTDFAALNLFKSSIPPVEKTIKLRMDISDITEIFDIVGGNINLQKNIVVHCGKWWKSKTFSEEFWTNLVTALAERYIPQGYNISLVGKTIVGEKLEEKQGYVNIKCPEGVLDFRDCTTLGNFIALIGQAEIVITNDSSAVHLAGAFDPWLIVFSTAKASWNILPYRNGTQYYKTLSLEKTLLVDDLETRWLEWPVSTIDSVPFNKTTDDYLPDISVVTDNIDKIIAGKMPLMPMLPENIYPKEETTETIEECISKDQEEKLGKTYNITAESLESLEKILGVKESIPEELQEKLINVIQEYVLENLEKNSNQSNGTLFDDGVVEKLKTEFKEQIKDRIEKQTKSKKRIKIK